MNYKNIFIALILLLFNATFVNAQGVNFVDIYEDSSSRIYELVDQFYELEIINGYPDNTFRPYKNVNRAEFIKVIVETLTAEQRGSHCYEDVKNQWFAPYICMAKNLGIVNGYTDGYFYPEKSITFVEAAKILVKAFNIEKENTKNSAWYYDDVMALEAINNIPESILGLEYKIRRDQMLELVYRIKYQDPDQTVLSNSYEWLLEQRDYLSYISTQEAIEVLNDVEENSLRLNEENSLNRNRHSNSYQIIHENDAKSFLQEMDFEVLSDYYPHSEINLAGCESEKFRDENFDERLCDERLLTSPQYNKELGNISFDLFEINSKYLFLWLYQPDDYNNNLFNTILAFIYDLETKKFVALNSLKERTEIHLYQDQLFFNTSYGAYDLKNKAYIDYSAKAFNKSQEWWLEENEGNIIAQNFNEKHLINLGEIPKELEAHTELSFFETNDSNTKFALPVFLPIEAEYYSNNAFKYTGKGKAMIIYGDLKENGFNEAKVYETNIGYIYTDGGDSINPIISWRDNLIITKPIVPYLLEFTIFDTEKGNFIYRNNEVSRNIQQQKANLVTSIADQELRREFRLYSKNSNNCSDVPGAGLCFYEVYDLDTGELLYENSESANHYNWTKYATWNNPIQWVNAKSILNKSTFGDSCGYQVAYSIYDFEQEKTVETIYKYSMGPGNPRIKTLHFENKDYFFDDSKEGKLTIYRINTTPNYEFYNAEDCETISIFYDKLIPLAEMELTGEFSMNTESPNGIYFYIGIDQYEFSPEKNTITKRY